ncbi:hypothetical protein PAXRUDRAFT_525673 [Paxillus rubicundulus Ve08.2h10]|uniref:Unplaced genomic scaffold scaffold_38, whole genome shotgun sequence n=1 Tax=Paxillus rubicundulus Ve08.2h10 TaxID=930991 RepID=A0A0D0DW50_9AGAM|nr:hypothetical protein PAXRUDRAFT_525673 [Paxillus rubicundulus Ve08.2h10]
MSGPMVEKYGIVENPVCAAPSSHSSHDEDADEENGGDYSTRMEELFDGDVEEEEDDEEEGFLYDGVDAERITGANYREQLRDVLGPDDTSDTFEEDEVERSLFQEDLSENRGDVSGNGPSRSTLTSFLTLLVFPSLLPLNPPWLLFPSSFRLFQSSPVMNYLNPFCTPMSLVFGRSSQQVLL